MNRDTKDRLNQLIKSRRHKKAILNKLKPYYLAYLTHEFEDEGLKNEMIAELKSALVDPAKHTKLLGDKTNYDPILVGEFANPTGAELILVAQLQKEKNAVAGLNEVRTKLETNSVALKAVDTAILAVKADKVKKNKDEQDLNFGLIYNDKGKLPDITEDDLALAKGMTQIDVVFYQEHVLQECAGNLVKFKYRANGSGPAFVRRAEGKDGENIDLVEGAAVSVFPSDDGELTMRVRNRNYRTEDNAPSQVPGGKYMRQPNDYPPVNYTISRIVPGSLEVCRGGKWFIVNTKD